ncbi:MAG: V-type ATP synthase subunit A [Thermoproteota archaeon]|nr:MAG: V-type ATP synthase subunit A [Candidatus Korarchaeota archaeon]
MGLLERISGSVIEASGIKDISIGEIVEVGDEGLIGEVIRIFGDKFTAQVYEDTTGLKPGEKVRGTNRRLEAELGPGLLNNILDGIGRPLEMIKKLKGPYITRGVRVNTLPTNIKWDFEPIAKEGDIVGSGDVIGIVKETEAVEHKILVPYGVKGRVGWIRKGKATVDEPVLIVKSDNKEIEVTMKQYWPIRVPRPFAADGRLSLEKPLITGQRVIDTFFPIPKGGTAAIPGGFGTGKTVMLHQLAKWSDAKVVIYIGCGERGNEMCEVVTEFPKLTDPYTGRPLMERTVLIANTSNMPVAARESSIYFGVTIGEYFRDQGYDVALMADSTSRWAEAMREVSGRLEEMPAEMGYPAYLPDRIAGFYERAGRVKVIGKPDREGSLTIIGAVSPPGGDFNEPVTIHTLRFTGVFWALDAELAYSRHFPAINWLKSYSIYSSTVAEPWAQSFSQYARKISAWWERKHIGFLDYRRKALDLLGEAAEVESIARVIGESSLPDEQRMILLASEILKEGFLRQNAFDEVDSYCEIGKQFCLLKLIVDFYMVAAELVSKGVSFERIRSIPQIHKMMRVKEDPQGIEAIKKLSEEISVEISNILKEYDLEGVLIGGERCSI